MNQKTGITHTLIVLVASRKPRLGPEGPPRNNVTAIALIVITFMNSARKKIAKRIPVYSVWNPPTSSCSASTRSNGGWFVSATAAMRKITKATIAGRTVPRAQPVEGWVAAPRLAFDDPPRRERPRLDQHADQRQGRTRLRSSESWADARTEPRSGYFEPDDHPASRTPYRPRPDIASSQSTPMGSSASWRNVSWPATRDQAADGHDRGTRGTPEGSTDTAREEDGPVGALRHGLLLEEQLMPSARVWRIPNGPARSGPDPVLHVGDDLAQEPDVEEDGDQEQRERRGSSCR